MALLGVLALLCAYAVFMTPDVRRRGWIAAVPTTALVVTSMVTDRPSESLIRDYRRYLSSQSFLLLSSRGSRATIPGFMRVTKPKISAFQILWYELYEQRARAGRLNALHRWMVLERVRTPDLDRLIEGTCHGRLYVSQLGVRKPYRIRVEIVDNEKDLDIPSRPKPFQGLGGYVLDRLDSGSAFLFEADLYLDGKLVAQTEKAKLAGKRQPLAMYGGLWSGEIGRAHV